MLLAILAPIRVAMMPNGLYRTFTMVGAYPLYTRI